MRKRFSNIRQCFKLYKMPKKRTPKNVFSSPNRNREKTRVYAVSYLKLGFVSDDGDKTKPHCMLRCISLCNNPTKNKKLERHRKNVHSEHAKKSLENFQRLGGYRQKKWQMPLTSLFEVQINLNKRGTEFSSGQEISTAHRW